MALLVNNLQDKFTVEDALVEVVTRAVAETLAFTGYSDEAEVSLVFCDDAYIRELNRNYRGIDNPTDVLSFAMLEETEDEPDYESPLEENLLGDIVISLERAAQQAEEYGHSFERELAFLAVHGMLHLLGYDHQEEDQRQEMRAREEAVLEKLGLSR